MEKMVDSLIEQQKMLEETRHHELHQTITMLKVQVKELEQKNETLARDNQQLIEVRLAYLD